jgi:hypothetical protein
MAEEESRRVATDSPKSAAGFVRRSAKAIREGATGISQYRAEYNALIAWARARERLLPFTFIERFAFIGDFLNGPSLAF